MCSIGQRSKWEKGCFVKLPKGTNGALHQALGSNWCETVLPKNLHSLPPFISACLLGEYELLSIPDAQFLGIFGLRLFRLQSERLAGVLENRVDFNENTRPKLHPLMRITVGIDSR